MKKIFTLFLFITLCMMNYQIYAETDSVSCTFFMYPKAPVGCYTYVSYQGNAPSSATFDWNFDGGIIISGTGPGPYYIIWDTLGYKTVTLHVIYGSQSCNGSMPNSSKSWTCPTSARALPTRAPTSKAARPHGTMRSCARNPPAGVRWSSRPA